MLSIPSSKALTPILLSLACATVVAQGQLATRGQIVQAVGDAVPGLAGATIFATSNFDNAVIDQNGTVLYRARFQGGGSTTSDDRGYFLGRTNGDLRMVVRAADQAPGCAAGTLLRSSSATAGSNGLSSSPRISPFGEYLYFLSSLYDPTNPANTPTTSDTALFWGPVGGLQLLSREGTTATFLPDQPLFGSQTFSYQNNPINASGQVLFSTTLTIGSGSPAVVAANDTVMVTGLPGALTVVSRENDVLPGGEVVIPVSGTQTLSFVNQINELGYVLHELRFGVTAPSTATTANDRAVAVWISGTDVIVAREGQQAPGLPTGVLFATPTLAWSPSVGSGTFTRSGNMMLVASLDGGGTTTTNDTGLYFGGLGGWTLVARKGDPCPGQTDGSTFGSFGTSSTNCDDAGNVAFIGNLTGGSVTTSNDSSIWVGTPGNLRLMAREGSVAPGLAPSANGPWIIDQISQGTNSPYLGSRGTVMWQCSVIDGVSFKSVYYSYTPERGLELQLLDTDTFTTTLGTATWTTIGSTGTFTSGDGGCSWFNNNGDFVNRYNLSGGPTAAVIRGHVGGMVATPSSIPVSTGGTQTMYLNAGVANANRLYVVVGSLSGTRPGFAFGGYQIPLNLDWWFNLSISAANTSVYGNTFSVLDPNGRATATFNYPPGFPSFAGSLFSHAYGVLDANGNLTYVSEPSNVKVY